ncbi:NAD(P)/FAD-dependent oxidoreductase [Nocardia puris]|uniref:flavin-containing monooxygenase n=1 Tax=Nocardia TaxID=1817 RepID=UPI0009DD6B91|nr:MULTISPECIES: NAD(P)/FAD-dependent oxidoreductase [Nocardia]MBF6137171.1 NAD(P)/FAD-dependent oxidoreductase [Nocardia otitidiscaviarum]MBF6181775.1 NAD(P)/FAD-dependent oxidoreductase [Nocardia otitidiscaviarum]MBF6216361.1 NAD(P)/FAD-dependent oxidoreductase [Nocardia puris]MBF6461667.1 NAD(P)/FAD-dependent oxidoreductase [Nocardia puris]MBF6488069.1 NAD(P)/FAD-dependent oxidoreductase [Nocardia otitidiscaviarum]
MIDKRQQQRDDPGKTIPAVTRVLIIGAGLSGIGTAIRLRCAGIEDIVVLERATGPGGAWRDNVYPGAHCDIPSVLGSFSLARNPRGSHEYSSGADILAYIHDVIARHGLERRIWYGRTVIGLDFDEAAGTWRVRTSTSGGEEVITARSVVMAVGPLSNTSRPDIVGIDGYRGHKVYSARWDPSLDVTGLTVAVVGTGATAVQVIPELVNRARHVTVFQHTPRWVLPHPQYRVPAWNRSLFEKLPLTKDLTRTAYFWAHEAMRSGVVWPTGLTTALEQVAKLQLRRQIKDKWTRRQLTPNYRANCQQLLVSNAYLPALDRDHCKLLTFPIVRLTERGILTVDGVERCFDTIVFATGFDVPCKIGTPFPIRGRDAHLLREEWAEGACAYKSVHVSGYPNLHFTFGPNSCSGRNSALFFLEAQIDYIVESVRMLERWGLRYLDARKSAQDRFNAGIRQRFSGTTRNSRCASWHPTEDGFNPTIFPGSARQFRAQMDEFTLSDYHAVSLSE